MKIKSVLVLLVLVVLSFLVYSNVYHAGFVFDDSVSITENAIVQSFPDVGLIWQKYKTRFIPYLSFSINYYLSAQDAQDYHMLNVLLHCICAIVVYFLVWQLLNLEKLKKKYDSTQAFYMAVFSAVIFAVHPLQTQAVSYISQRIAVLVTLFYLSTVLFYILYRTSFKWIYYLLSIICACAAVLTKETSFTLIGILLICDVLLFEKTQNWKERILKRLFPFFCIVLAIPLMLYFSFVQSGTITSVTRETSDVTRLEYFLTQIHVVIEYIRLFFNPINLNVDYDFPIVRSMDVLTGLKLFSLLAIVLWALTQAKKNVLVTFGVLWFFIVLSIESSFIPIKDVIQEHRMYLASLGLIVPTVVFLFKILERRRAISLITVVVVVLCVLTFQRNKVWRSEYSLWQDARMKSPNKARPYDNLAAHHIKNEEYDEALYYLNRAITINDQYVETYNNFGVVYIHLRDYELARNYLEKGLAIDADSVGILNNFGILEMNAGNYDKAEDYFLAVLDINSSFYQPINNLLYIYGLQNNFDKAIKLMNILVEKYPANFSYQFKLLELYKASRQSEKMQEMARFILENTRDTRELVKVGVHFAQEGNALMGLAFFEKALKVNPMDINVYIELGKVYGNANDFESALAIWRDGLNRDPNNMTLKLLINKTLSLQMSK